MGTAIWGKSESLATVAAAPTILLGWDTVANFCTFDRSQNFPAALLFLSPPPIKWQMEMGEDIIGYITITFGQITQSDVTTFSDILGLPQMSMVNLPSPYSTKGEC